MPQPNKEFCYCTLALRSKYRALAKELAKDLEHYAPGAMLVVGTDKPADFEGCSNILAFEQQQQGILHCYHDKRFVIEHALTQFRAAILLDADTKVIDRLPDQMEWKPGLTALHVENLVEHVTRYTPQRLVALQKVADKIGVSLKDTTYVGEALFVIASGHPGVGEFIRQWGIVGRYLELHGIHAGSGNAIGLAAAKAGLPIISESSALESIDRARKHLDASYRRQSNAWDRFKRRLDYHYRLNQARIVALKDFNFYYR